MAPCRVQGNRTAASNGHDHIDKLKSDEPHSCTGTGPPQLCQKMDSVARSNGRRGGQAKPMRTSTPHKTERTGQTKSYQRTERNTKSLCVCDGRVSGHQFDSPGNQNTKHLKG